MVKEWLAMKFLILRQGGTTNSLCSASICNIENYKPSQKPQCNHGLRPEFSSHTKTIIKPASCHLKNVSRIKGLLSWQDLEKLVHVFIFSRLNYFKGVFTGLSKKSIIQLQLIQNADA